MAVSVSFGYGTYLYDVATRNRVATLTNPEGFEFAAGVLFGPDGTMMAVMENHIYLWDVMRNPPSAGRPAS